MGQQLALDVGLADIACFDNFHVTDANREIVDALRNATTGEQYFIYGAVGAGKTHLLHAVLRDWVARGGPGCFWSPSAPAPRENALLCVDDLHDIAGDLPAERQLFTHYERVRAQSGLLLMAAERPPRYLPWRLPDLMSRISSATVYRLDPLGDADVAAALRLRAQSRGFDLPEDVIAYILRRYRRDSASLFGLLDLIDAQSLAAGRRVTLPFLRDLEQRYLR